MKKFGFLSVTSVAACLAFMVLAGTDGHATTVDTFDFTQGGYDDNGLIGVVAGRFTGTVNDNGYIELADLTRFSATFTVWGLFSDPVPGLDSFSFLPNDASTLDFASAGPLRTCVGASAAFGVCGPVGAGHLGFAAAFFSDEAPVVTLVSSITTAVPEPSTWAMLLLGFVGLGFMANRRKSRPTLMAA